MSRFGRAASALRDSAMEAQILPAIDVQARRVQSGVELYGSADLPDGTILRYDAHAPGWIGILKGGRAGTVLVIDGAYSVVFERTPWRGHRLDVIISLRADRYQPAETQTLLGDHGQRMVADVGGAEHAEFFLTKSIDIQREGPPTA